MFHLNKYSDFLHIFFFSGISAMESRCMTNKLYRYALFFFPESQKVGTVPTNMVCDGCKSNIRVGNYMLVDWDGQRVWGHILMLHGKSCSVQLVLCAFSRCASTITRSMTCLLSKIHHFQILPLVQLFFIRCYDIALSVTNQ